MLVKNLGIVFILVLSLNKVSACESQQSIFEGALLNCSETQREDTISCVTNYVTTLETYSLCSQQYSEVLDTMLEMIAVDQTPEVSSQEEPDLAVIEPESCNISGHDGFMITMMSQCVGENNSFYQDRLCSVQG